MTDYTFPDVIADPNLVSGFDPTLDRLVFTNISATQVLVLWASNNTQFITESGSVTLQLTRDQLANGANISFADGSILTVGDDSVETASDSLGNAFTGDTAGVGSQYHGLSGADTVHGGSGGDLAYGNKGDDVLLGGGGGDSLYGGQGNDSISGWGLNDNPTSLDATSIAQLIYGNLENDTMISGDGDDLHYGGQGDDLIYAHGGNDIVYGNKGSDYLDGAAGFDQLYGGQGADTVIAGTGNDWVYGNLENDVLDAGGSADTVYGGQGDDIIIAGTGDDVLLGNKGSDTLTGGSGGDQFVFTPGAGSDTDVVTDYALGIDALDIRRTDVSEINIVQEGADVRVTLGSLDQILFQGVSRADILNEMTPFLDTVAAGLTLSVEVNAGGRTTGGEFLVSSYVEDRQDAPVVAALADGGFVVTWESSNRDGNGSGVFGQIYNADGTTQGEEFQVNTYTYQTQWNQRVAALADGGFVVTWQSLNQDGDSFGVYGQRYNADGSTFGDEFRINTYTNNTQDVADVAALADGGFVVTWKSWGQDGSASGIFGQRYYANGDAYGNEFQVNTYSLDYQSWPAVSSLADGGFVITWNSYGQDGDGSGIYGQRYNSDGIPIGNELKISTYTAGDQEYSALASLAEGGFVVTWQSPFQDGSGYGIFGQLYNADGSPNGDEFQINSFLSGAQKNCSVAPLADGGFMVTWHSWEQDGSDFGIYGQRFDAAGNQIGGEFQVNSYTHLNQFYPSVAATADGGFVVAWSSYGQDEHIYGQRFPPLLDPTTQTTLEITTQLVDLDGSETLSFTIAGVPLDATLSAGTDNGDGSWTLTEAELSGLTLSPAADFFGTIDLTITARATETASGDTATQTENLTLVYGAAGHTLTGSAADDTMTGELGDDTLAGLAGADRFRYANINYDGHDTILDFTPGVDHIDMDVLFDTLGIAVGTRGPYLAQVTSSGDNVITVTGYESQFSITLTGVTDPIAIGTDIWLSH